MERTRGGRIGGATVLCLLLLAGAAWAVTVKSPLFDVRDVRVVGAARVSPQEIAGLAAVAEGTNILLLPVEEVARSVRSNPWIAEVDVRRDLPSTLVVRVRERSPVAWVAGPEGGAVVSGDGTVLRLRGRAGGLPRVGRVEHLPDPGEHVEGIAPALRAASSLPPRLRREVARIVEREAGELILHLGSGIRVLYGPAEALAPKAAALEPLLSWVREEGVEVAYVDVRAPGTPAVRPLAEPEAPDLSPGG